MSVKQEYYEEGFKAACRAAVTKMEALYHSHPKTSHQFIYNDHIEECVVEVNKLEPMMTTIAKPKDI